jgi:hypothetical protein
MDTNDELDNNVQRSISDVSNNELCTIHNEEYILVSDDNMYCDKCDTSCDHVYNTIEEWKKQTLIEMQKFEDKLNNKIKGLNCICEIINNHVDNNSIIKQIEDIIDTIYVDISHIYNFNQLINDLPTSNIIKRKNIILNKPINIISDILPIHLIEFIDIIVKNDGDIHADDDFAFRYASFKYLISHGANIHAKNDSAFIWASNNGHLAVVECLLSHGVDVHTYNDRALIWACYMGHLEVVKCLIFHDANVHVDNGCALKIASCNGHLAVAEYLKLSINRT